MSDETKETPGGAPAQPNSPAAEASAAPAAFELPKDFAYRTDQGGLDFDRLSTDLSAFKTLKEADEARRKEVPESADKYALALEGPPRKLPDGSPLEIKDTDPLWGSFRTFAHESGLSQKAVNKLIGLYADAKLSELTDMQGAAKQAIEDRAAAEMAKLADPKETNLEKAAEAGVARWTAVEDGLVQRYGDKGKEVAAQLRTAAAVEVFESLLASSDIEQIGANGTRASVKSDKPFYQSTDYYKPLNLSARVGAN